MPTGFAELNDVEAVPGRGSNTAETYKAFLNRPIIGGRAFAVSTDPDKPGWSWANGYNSQSKQSFEEKALQLCEEKAGAICRLYAVDDQVVW